MYGPYQSSTLTLSVTIRYNTKADIQHTSDGGFTFIRMVLVWLRAQDKAPTLGVLLYNIGVEIISTEPYEDRGIIRRRIEWRDGDASGVADTHCTVTGWSLGPNYTLCVRHCREYGHFSREACSLIHSHIILKEITASEMGAAFLRLSRFPEDMLD